VHPRLDSDRLCQRRQIATFHDYLLRKSLEFQPDGNGALSQKYSWRVSAPFLTSACIRKIEIVKNVDQQRGHRVVVRNIAMEIIVTLYWPLHPLLPMATEMPETFYQRGGEGMRAVWNEETISSCPWFLKLSLGQGRKSRRTV
jgi:hypothetical protein